jgi:hypothetical protein
LTREEIIRDYAEYAQKEQQAAPDHGEYIPNSLLIKPLINLFTGEYEGGSFRKTLVKNSSNKALYKDRVKECILDTLEFYRALNPEALDARNGQRIIRPSFCPRQ